jgi:radical SAM protein with 4Fe4S-binding SPASM domain
MNESAVDSAWIAPALPELKVVERDGRWLCLNPRVPAWILTTRSAALLLQRIDGRRSIDEYFHLLKSHGVDISAEQLLGFFQAAAGAKLFASVEEEALAGTPWQNRRLQGLYLHLSDRCNLQCVYCYRESSPKVPVRHEARRFCEALESIRPFAVPGALITFSGGEPLLYPGFREVVETSSSLGYSNLLLTNGSLLTEDLADFVRIHFKGVKISLDGPTEEIHAKTRGKGNFRRVVRGIEMLAQRGLPVAVQVTLTQSGLDSANEVRQALAGAPGVKIRFTPLLPMGRGGRIDSESIDNDRVYEFSKTENGLGIAHVPGRPNRGCGAGLSSLSIADTGDVYPCHLFHAEEFRFGNIFHDSFEDIFYGARIREYVGAMDVEANNPECRSCEVRLLCGGGCHANALHATGDYRGVDTFCSFIKRSIYDDLFGQKSPRQKEILPVV